MTLTHYALSCQHPAPMPHHAKTMPLWPSRTMRYHANTLPLCPTMLRPCPCDPQARCAIMPAPCPHDAAYVHQATMPRCTLQHRHPTRTEPYGGICFTTHALIASSCICLLTATRPTCAGLTRAGTSLEVVHEVIYIGIGRTREWAQSSMMVMPASAQVAATASMSQMCPRMCDKRSHLAPLACTPNHTLNRATANFF